jgi:hypothetical protein
MNEINVKIFQFVQRLKPFSTPNPPNPSLPKMKGGEPIIDLGPVQNFSVITTDPIDQTYTSKYVDIDGQMLGLNQEDFKELKNLLVPLLDIAPYDKFADIQFLIQNTFDWIVTVGRQRRAETEVCNYLVDRLNSSINKYTYYFRVRSILIEEPFSIGNGYIGVFSEEEIQHRYLTFLKAKPDTSIDEFRKLFDSHFKGVHVRITVRGISAKSETVAKRKAELIIDIIKCFCSKWSIQRNYDLLDLDFRQNARGYGNFMCVPNDDFSQTTLLLRNSERVLPVEITKSSLKEFEKLGLKEFSYFLDKDHSNEVSDLIIDSIRLLSQAMSTINPYEKVVRIISFIENIVIRKNNEGRAKGHTKVKIVISKIISNQSDLDRIKKAFGIAYNVRDKYLHNYMELPLDIDTVFYILEFSRAVILKLIRLSGKRTMLNEIYDFFELE